MENLLLAASPSLFHIPSSLHSSLHFSTRSRVLFLGEPKTKAGVYTKSLRGCWSKLWTHFFFQDNLLTITDRAKSVLFYFSPWHSIAAMWYKTKQNKTKRKEVWQQNISVSLKTYLRVPVSFH